MKNKLSNLILIVIILLLCTFIVFFSINYLNTDKKVVKSGKEIKQSSSNSLALMLETAAASGEYQVSTDSTWPATGYDFNSTLSKCENGSTLTYDIVTKKVKVQSTKSDNCYVFFDKITTFAETLIINNGTIGMDHHTATLVNGANDGSYRFSGANPDNYVCFGPGSTAAGVACPEENQYRIIGVFGNQVKLIKKTSLGNKVWNSSDVNTWAGSTMDTYLNGEYLNNLTPTWSNKIASNTWQVGGMPLYEGLEFAPARVYNYEVGPNKANVTFNGKMGLMYVSDYGFAAQPQAWTLCLGRYHDNVKDYSNPIAKENNWLFTNIYEWTISINSFENSYIFSISSNVWNQELHRPIGGFVFFDLNSNSLATRPSFYLESSTNLIGGNGTPTDPYRV